ncbi:hypothetical protein AGLY_008444 [Aphis glycines]|uniref:TTF-type domain-containing protein n=1 Tax=Aphis glycines TaxID=307491 RepID=A0A6G0TKF0_APHGL|nr:hypothetical protein AGLY_008444 [Aphis glycines]
MPSGYEKRKKKTEDQEKLLKLPKISSFFSNTTPRENKSEIIIKSVNTEVNSEQSVELSSVDCEKSEVSAPEMLSSCSYYKDAQTKRFIIENGHSRPKAKGPFAKNSDVSKSGLKIERSWLCYSTILQKAYCRSCWLFGDRTSTGFQKIWTTGYCNWKHIVDGIKRHEQSHVHYISCLVYEKWFLNKTLNEELEQSIKKEKLFWRQVLERILNITLTLAMRSLPFRGHREKFGSGKGENGNFICFIELLAKYDPVLEKVVNQGNNKVNYCSPKIQNELIQLISNKVKNKSFFFSIIIDTTQDISKVDQLSEIYRYCVIEKDEYGNPKNVCVKETFLAFHEVVDQSASSLSELILQNIEKKGLSIAKCRGQGYDGAANMSGMYNGLQKRIKDIEPSAAYVHCSAHNLNLVVNDAVKEITEMEIFFDVVQRVFVFFGHSIVRWRILSDLIKESNSQNGLLIKKLNPTRWAGRYEAVFALKIRFVEIQKALTKVILCSSKLDEKNEAEGIKKQIENYNFICTLVFQCKILQIINLTSKILQSKSVDLDNASNSLKNCYKQLKEYRILMLLLEEANIVAKSWSISTEFQNKRRKVVKKYFDELCTDMRLTCPESLFRVTIFNRALDILINQISKRFSSFHELMLNFTCLQPSFLTSATDLELLNEATKLVNKYDKDISKTFTSEILAVRSTLKNQISQLNSTRDLAQLLMVKNHSLTASFPEVCTALLLFLTIPVTSASAERSFSKLKIIKGYLRSTMMQDRLSGLALISIEQETAREVDFENLIDMFAEKKARKKKF